VKLLYWLGFVLVCLTVGVGVYLLMPRTVTVESVVQPPLTYTNLRVEPPAEAKVGERINIVSTRCQNTEGDMSVDISIFFQSADKKHLIPFTLPVGVSRFGTGPVFEGVIIPPGCVVDNRSMFLIPDYVTPGEWRFKGQVCFGGVTIDLPSTCTGWESDLFRVLGAEEAVD
jgi:hypothetical protein